jgi:outer membrane protein
VVRHHRLQVGKPLQNVNGWPLDFVSYASLTNHNDRVCRPTACSLTEGFYTGFPWSRRVKTRRAWAMNGSLAQRAPYIETSNQTWTANRLRACSNYLDPTLDVSLGDLVGSRALKDTFIGFGCRTVRTSLARRACWAMSAVAPGTFTPMSSRRCNRTGLSH